MTEKHMIDDQKIPALIVNIKCTCYKRQNMELIGPRSRFFQDEKSCVLDWSSESYDLTLIKHLWDAAESQSRSYKLFKYHWIVKKV